MVAGRFLACLAGLLFTGTFRAEGPDGPKARKALVGVWKGFAVEGLGATPDRGPVKLELTITEKTIRGIELKQDDSKRTVDHGSGEFTLDLAPSPHHLDAMQANGKGRKVQYLGIYKVEGDTLKWCVTRTKTRPTTFQTGKGAFLLILKREPRP